MAKEFKKIDIDLPRQPVADERPWLVAGLLLVVAILVFAAYAYSKRQEKEPVVVPAVQRGSS